MVEAVSPGWRGPAGLAMSAGMVFAAMGVVVASSRGLRKGCRHVNLCVAVGVRLISWYSEMFKVFQEWKMESILL